MNAWAYISHFLDEIPTSLIAIIGGVADPFFTFGGGTVLMLHGGDMKG